MWRSLPMERTTTSPEFRPTRIWRGIPRTRWTSSAYRFTVSCIRSAACQARPCLLGVLLCEQLHGPFEVGEQHGDLLALALERALGGQDLLREVLRRVALRGGESGRGGARR